MDQELKDTLGLIIDKLGTMDSNLTKMDARLSKLEEGQAELQADVGSLKADMRAVKVKLEVDIPKQFGLLTDGHKGLVEKFAEIDRMADSLDEMKGSMVALETYILQNRSSIIELQKAKG